MKKLMIMGAAFGLAFSAWAQAQVYEMTMTIKSTIGQKGKITSILPCAKVPDTSETGDFYRKQSTIKIKGLIWGCDCETITEPVKIDSAAGTYGYIFWNETTKKVIASDFTWKMINRIDSKAKKSEGTWTLGDDEELFLMGAGFGTIKDTIDKKQCMITSTVVTPMSGNVAGWMKMPSVIVKKGTEGTCDKCEQVEGTDDVIAVVPSWSVCCVCGCDEGSELTAASGTWNLKFHTSASKAWSRVSADVSITEVYKFPDYVKAYILSL